MLESMCKSRMGNSVVSSWEPICTGLIQLKSHYIGMDTI